MRPAVSPGGTVGVTLPDGSVIGLAVGQSDTILNLPMRPTDLMMAGSVGKTFFAAVAYQLITEGRIGLDDPIAKYLGAEPWFVRLPNAADITIRMLMNHTSGLVRYEFDDAFTRDLKADPYRPGSRKSRSHTCSTRSHRSLRVRVGTIRTPTTSCSP